EGPAGVEDAVGDHPQPVAVGQDLARLRRSPDALRGAEEADSDAETVTPGVAVARPELVPVHPDVRHRQQGRAHLQQEGRSDRHARLELPWTVTAQRAPARRRPAGQDPEVGAPGPGMETPLAGRQGKTANVDGFSGPPSPWPPLGALRRGQGRRRRYVRASPPAPRDSPPADRPRAP